MPVQSFAHLPGLEIGDIPLESLPNHASHIVVSTEVISQPIFQTITTSTTDPGVATILAPAASSENTQAACPSPSTSQPLLLSTSQWLKTELHKAIDYLERPTALVGVVIGIICAVLGFMGYQLQAWTARKDYLQYCRHAIVGLFTQSILNHLT
jgi:hypothetical protein